MRLKRTLIIYVQQYLHLEGKRKCLCILLKFLKGKVTLEVFSRCCFRFILVPGVHIICPIYHVVLRWLYLFHFSLQTLHTAPLTPLEQGSGALTLQHTLHSPQKHVAQPGGRQRDRHELLRCFLKQGSQVLEVRRGSEYSSGLTRDLTTSAVPLAHADLQ